jgi:hypothetical protein
LGETLREAKLDEWISLCRLNVASVVRSGNTTQPREGPTAQWDRQTHKAIPEWTMTLNEQPTQKRTNQGGDVEVRATILNTLKGT